MGHDNIGIIRTSKGGMPQLWCYDICDFTERTRGCMQTQVSLQFCVDGM